MVAIVRAESLKSFREKRKHIFVDTFAVLKSQRQAIFDKIDKDRKKEAERNKKMEMIKGD